MKDGLFSADYSFKSLFEASFYSAYLYVFFEWLFIVTKPSFFGGVFLFDRIRIFYFSASLVAAACLLVVTMLALLAALFPLRQVKALLLNLGALIPTIILAALVLLLIDNFTYTLFQFGVITTDGVTRFLYLLGFLVLAFCVFFQVKIFLANYERNTAGGSLQDLLFGATIILILGSFLLTYERPAATGMEGGVQKQNANMPNIILITADGLNADHLSAYGYDRDTTPRIKELAQHALFAENAFNNSSLTPGSVVSIYTGKYPTRTRLLLTPDILKGSDAYQHFPNILRGLGYYNLQYTFDVHVDAFDRNVLAGFDEANGKMIRQDVYQSWLSKYLKTDYSYFLYELGNRINDRLRHIFFIQRMTTRAELTLGEKQRFNDQAKLDRVLEVVKTSPQPVFAHIHWMGTHGKTFYPSQRTYSKGKGLRTQADWDPDFYDDSIIDFDAGIGQIIDRLKEMGAYDRTVIIVGTDHSQNYHTTKRIPLLIRFPYDQHQRTITDNVQNLDIAPTLLEYLGIEPPDWMQGSSILTKDPGERPIIAAEFDTANGSKSKTMGPAWAKPPFYQFGYMSVVYCNRWYRLHLQKHRWESGPVEGHTGSCGGRPPLQDETAFLVMRDRLQADGFDVTSLADFSKMVKVGAK